MKEEQIEGLRRAMEEKAAQQASILEDLRLRRQRAAEGREARRREPESFLDPRQTAVEKKALRTELRRQGNRLRVRVSGRVDRRVTHLFPTFQGSLEQIK